MNESHRITIKATRRHTLRFQLTELRAEPQAELRAEPQAELRAEPQAELRAELRAEPRAELKAQCPNCARAVETITCARAAEVLGIDGQGLAELIAAGRVHAIALVSNNYRVCWDSLFVL